MSDDINDSGEKTDAGTADSPHDKGDAKHKGIKPVKEIGGREGPDPTRYGDWEKNGRCVDF